MECKKLFPMILLFFDQMWGHSGPKTGKRPKKENRKCDNLLISIDLYDLANNVKKIFFSKIPIFSPFMGPYISKNCSKLRK